MKKYIQIVCLMIMVLSMCFSSDIMAEELSISEEEYHNYFNGDEVEVAEFRDFLIKTTQSKAHLFRSFNLERVNRVVQFGDGTRWISILKVNGRIVFCANPYITAGIGMGYDESYDWGNLSWEAQWRIWMIARFSYQVEPTDAMYVAAQTMIWEALGFYESPWMDISVERERIESRISQRNKKVSFSGNEYQLRLQEKTVLVDTNDVLQNMVITCPEGMTCLKENNELHLTINHPDFVGESQNIRIYQEGNLDPTWVGIVYTKNEYQPVLAVTDWIDPGNEAYISVKLGKGNLIIDKKGEYGKLLSDQKFYLAYDDLFQDIIDEYTTDENGKILLEHLVAGTYYLKEIETTVEYELNPKVYKIQVNPNETITIEVINHFRKIDLIVEKVDENQKGVYLNGATFQIFQLAEEETFLGEYISGALFIKGQAGVKYKVYQKGDDFNLMNLKYEFVTNDYGEILEYIEEGEYIGGGIYY